MHYKNVFNIGRYSVKKYSSKKKKKKIDRAYHYNYTQGKKIIVEMWVKEIRRQNKPEAT